MVTAVDRIAIAKSPSKIVSENLRAYLLKAMLLKYCTLFDCPPQIIYQLISAVAQNDPIPASCLPPDTKIALSKYKEGRYAKRVRSLMEYLENARDLVDIGCGNNRFGKAVIDANPLCRVIGTDVDSDTSFPLQKEPQLLFRFQSDPTKIELRSKSADLTTLFFVLHHIEYYRQNAILKEAYRILRPAGTLILFEDSYYKDTFNISQNSGLLSDFYDLSLKDRFTAYAVAEVLNKRALDGTRMHLVRIYPRPFEVWINMIKKCGFTVNQASINLPDEEKCITPIAIAIAKK